MATFKASYQSDMHHNMTVKHPDEMEVHGKALQPRYSHQRYENLKAPGSGIGQWAQKYVSVQQTNHKSLQAAILIQLGPMFKVVSHL